MKCISHPAEEAIGTCAKCGAGICNGCFHKSEYNIDGKPLCRNCNLDTMRDLLARSRKEMIGGGIRTLVNAVFIAIGLATYFSSVKNADSVATLMFWCGLGGFPTAWRAMRRDMTDHVRMGVEQASGDWSGSFIWLIIRVVLSFVFGCIVSPILMLWSIYKTWKSWITMKYLQKEIANFAE